MLNNPAPVATQRHPRGVAIINGQVVTGLVSFEVDQNSYYQADTFRATIALSAQPAATNLAWWASQSSLILELFAGFPADPDNYTKADLSSLILGNVDDIEIDPIADEITLSGRDFTGQFIDAQTSEKFPNLTASAIVAKLAERHGLQSKVTPTTTKVGTFYTVEKASLTQRQSEWDMLTYLAQQEQYSVFVRGKTVYFQPKAQPSDSPYVIQWQAPTSDRAYPVLNSMMMNFSRNMTLAKDIIVIYASSNHKSKKNFSVKVTATHNKNTVLSGAAQPVGTAQTYYRYKPGLTKQDLLTRAQALLHELSRHEIKMHVKMPADNILTTENIIKVVGTGTAFDQVYFPDSIVRSFGWDSGYTMTVNAKNHGVESEVSA
jgi:phage protein D